MELMCGTIKVTGKKKDVLNMFGNISDYFDKELVSAKGSENRYTIKFEFSSRIQSFLYTDYFQEYSKVYNCHIVATMHLDDECEDDTMLLEYKNGNIIHGIEEYGLKRH